MKTLLDYTLKILKDNGKTMEDIIWIGSIDFCIPKDNFIEIAKITTNTNDFILDDMPFDLVLVGQDFWLERNPIYESDTCSDLCWCWLFCQKPIRPPVVHTIKTLDRTKLSYKNQQKIPEFDVRLKHMLE